MKLKHAILETVSRDVLKQICADLEVTNVDQRSGNDMVAKLSRARRATPEKLLEYLSEAEVKQAAEKAGASSTGRRSMLIAALLEREDKGEEESMKPSDGDAPAPTQRTHSGNGSPKRSSAPEQTEQYRHANEAVQRPDIGVQDQFQAKRPPKTYRYDSSLDPALSWDEQRERDLGEWLLGLIEQAAREGEKLVFAEAQEWKGGGVRVTSTSDAVRLFRDISKPFLNWAGKAERHQISVPSVPLFVHERHSTKAILDGIRHRKAKGLSLDLFGDPNMDIRDQLEAYEHKGPWQNRMILGDSLQVMNSILEYEGLGGQVQTIYMDPPYGVRFGSNFQPFVRKRDVKDGADSDLTREPEMVKAYRDTWELGLHSYLTYLRDRLALSRELLHESGSIFVQISDANLHRVREVLDDIFGSENYCGIIGFQKTGGAASSLLPTTVDYLLWYCKSRASVKYNQLYEVREAGDPSLDRYDMIELPNGESRRLIPDELSGKVELPIGKRFQLTSLVSDGESGSDQQFHFRGKKYFPKAGSHWKTSVEGLNQLAQRHRIEQTGAGLRYRRYLEDFPVVPMTDRWESTQLGTRLMYVVQTAPTVVARCVLMTSDPGDLVFDPTCGSGTTAYVAEEWGRRWITCDTSRVPLALARQRLLTATFPYYELKDPKRGPAGGFMYNRKQNKKGEEIGGLVPHITLKSIANGESPAMEVLVDRPHEIGTVTRVSGPFVVEASIAPVQPLDVGRDGERASGDAATHVERMTEVLRQSKTLRLPGNRELVLSGIRRTTDSEFLHAEAKEGDKRIGIVFGPQDGAISSSLVFEGVREAYFLKYDQIYFFGFAIEANARGMIEGEKKLRIPAVYVAVTPDVAMSDLLKTTRASEIFSITGLPDFEVKKAKKKGPEGQALYEVELKGLDIFDPESLDTESFAASSVPCWMLDSDYDGMSFYATQVFFPKTSAWDSLQKSLKATFDETVWEHLAGTVSEPFTMGEKKRVAVKVIDERGNELLRVKGIEA